MLIASACKLNEKKKRKPLRHIAMFIANARNLNEKKKIFASYGDLFYKCSQIE